MQKPCVYNSATLLSPAAAVITFLFSAIFYVICKKFPLRVKRIYFKLRRRNFMHHLLLYNPLTGGMAEAFITYVYTKFDINLLCHVFICYLILRRVTALAVGYIQGASKFYDMCSLYFNLHNWVEILRMWLKLLLWKLNIRILKITL